MKNFNLFVAFLVCSTVAMASETPSTSSWTDTFNGLVASVKSCASTVCDYTVTPVNNALNSADAVVVEKTQTYVVAPTVNLVHAAVSYAQPATEYVKPATDKMVEYAALAKNGTCDAVAYSFAHPVTSMVVAAAAYAIYYAYTEHNAVATKKAKN